MLVRFETRLLAAFTAAVICTVLLSAITWRVGVEATQVTNSVSHTHEVLHQLARTRSDTIQIELSTQTFRISGNEALLLERDATAVAREKRLAQLEEATRDSPRQQERLGQLREVLAQRQDISRRVEVLRKTQGESAAAAFVASAPLQETRQRTYAILGEMDADERRLLDVRLAEQQHARQRVVLSGVLLSVLTTLMLLATYALIRRHFRDTAAARELLSNSEESLATTLQSIGDAVIATDAQGLITRMNPVAEQLTGWPLAQALGQPIGAVFHILHEHTRVPAEVPVTKVLASGQPQALANHTVLVARDGGSAKRLKSSKHWVGLAKITVYVDIHCHFPVFGIPVHDTESKCRKKASIRRDEGKVLLTAAEV